MKAIRREAIEMCQIAINIPDAVLYDTHMSKEEAYEFARRAVALGHL